MSVFGEAAERLEEALAALERRQVLEEGERGDKGVLLAMENALDGGAHPDGIGSVNLPPLSRLARIGFTDGMALLLAHGADPRQPDHRGFTPLHHAAWQDQVDATRLLIQSGAWPMPVGKNIACPLVEACERGSLKAATLLMGAGFDPRAIDGSGRSALGAARAYGWAELTHRVKERVQALDDRDQFEAELPIALYTPQKRL